jgi:hypothetical protein
LPDFMVRLPLPLEQQILIGAIRGDGHLSDHDRQRRRGLVTYATISETLAWQLWRLALRQGLSPALRIGKRLSAKTPHLPYTVDLYGTDVNLLGPAIFGKRLTTPQKTKRLCFRDENYMYIPIRSIDVEEHDGEVMNIEVANAHTYVAGGVVVHNCLGHIHKHQNLTARDSDLPPVVYSGSLERIDFGEEVEDKGFCWIELERGATNWEFIQVHARPFRTIRADVREEDDPTAAVIARIQSRDIEGAIVRVLIRLNESQEAALRRRDIEQALAPAANIAAISTEVERETRVPGVGAAPEALTPQQWLERYFISKSKPPERVQKLLQAAETLFDDAAA